jgi:hypothetical protein
MAADEVDAPAGRPGEELREAAATLRTLAAPNRPVPVPAFAPFAVAGLLEALGDALDDGVDGGGTLPDPVRRAALQLARHLGTHPPTPPTPSRANPLREDVENAAPAPSPGHDGHDGPSGEGGPP